MVSRCTKIKKEGKSSRRAVLWSGDDGAQAMKWYMLPSIGTSRYFIQDTGSRRSR
jgi:hypothetical protein